LVPVIDAPACLRAVQRHLSDLKLNATDIKLIAVVFRNNIRGRNTGWISTSRSS
jgi:hypothetical protein